jgi:hypothetical protein
MQIFIENPKKSQCFSRYLMVPLRMAKTSSNPHPLCVHISKIFNCIQLCKQPHGTLVENYHQNGCGSGWIISWTLCWTLPISKIWLIKTRRFGNFCVIFKWFIVLWEAFIKSFVCGKPAVKLLYGTHTKRDCTSALCIFNWNTSVTGHRERTVAFPQRK